MLEIIETDTFAGWMNRLRDREARGRIARRIDRLAQGNPGDVRAVGGGVSELRIDYAPGHRVYFCRRGEAVMLPLCGGDKRTQAHDIERAQRLASEV